MKKDNISDENEKAFLWFRDMTSKRIKIHVLKTIKFFLKPQTYVYF